MGGASIARFVCQVLIIPHRAGLDALAIVQVVIGARKAGCDARAGKAGWPACKTGEVGGIGVIALGARSQTLVVLVIATTDAGDTAGGGIPAGQTWRLAGRALLVGVITVVPTGALDRTGTAHCVPVPLSAGDAAGLVEAEPAWGDARLTDP